MCGRFSLAAGPGQLTAEFGIAEIPFDYRPRFNIAPSQDIAIALHENPGPRVVYARWGLIPFWAKDPAIGNRMINARVETVAEKPAFRAALDRRRCWVLADGFYEWQRAPGGKRPMRFRLRSGRPFALAGLWERWTSPEGEPVRSCTILTTAASEPVRPVHDRMPVILGAGARERWLDPDEPAHALLALLRSADGDGDELEVFPVSRLVNSPANDVAECFEPVTDAVGPGGNGELF